MQKNLKNIALLFVFVLSFISPASAIPVQAKNNLENVNPQSETNEIPTDRIIVKYKEGTSASFSPSIAPQMDRMSVASATPLEYVREMGEGDLHVLELPERMSVAEAEAIAQQLEALPEVEYAEPDLIYTVALEPDDIAYQDGRQWNLQDAWGINMPDAWDITTGSTSVVVAVVDTGYTEHTELDGRLIEEVANVVYGYDFVTPVIEANDGNGRDADPRDPGDWVTDTENNSAPFDGCGVTDSTWHGTHVAGIIGAQTNNNEENIAGIDWSAKILPVRVLGKCGGYTSDIVDGIRWAAGLTVSGVDDNLHPADIINLSFGRSGSCDQHVMQDAITEAIDEGIVVVAAAGNNNQDVSNFRPANCTGVISVAATDIDGQKANYSNWGSGIEISAPGGTSSVAGNGILSTSNNGLTSPDDEIIEEKSGTSMAAPHVSGVLALMFAVNPGLTPAQALQILENTAKDFPSGSCADLPATCGAGIVNAAAAVAAAEAPDLIITGYELVDLSGDPLTSDPLPDEAFGIRVISKNRGGTNTAGAFYRSVYVNRDPLNSSFEITSPEGCLYNLDTDENDWGDYRKEDFIGGIPAGVTDTNTIVEIPDGLPAGSYQIWLYADPLCNVEGESFEGNNAYGPINLTIGTDMDADVKVFVGGGLKGSYTILNDEYLLQSYPGQFGGPVLIDSTNGAPIVTSLRLLYNNKTFSELMGVPTSQLLDDYWMPVYIDNSTTDSQIRFTNTSTTQSTTVRVYIGGLLRGIYNLLPSSSERVRYIGVSGGPIQIVGTPGIPILAGMRVIYGGNSSFDEIMAYPTTQLTNEYWFPFYNHNNINLDTQVRIANTSSTSSTIVTIYIGSLNMGSYPIAPLSSQLISYPGVSGGPVRIVGTTGIPLVTSLRLLYNKKTFSELMGVPTTQLLDDYSLPVYIDDVKTDTQIRFTNTSAVQSTTVRIYLGGDLMGTYVLAPQSAERIRFMGVTGGPIRIVGTTGVPILAGERVIYGGNSSFDEIMAYPTSQLASEYWFPFYNHNNINLDTEARIGVP